MAPVTLRGSTTRGAWLVALPLLLTVYIPRTEALGAHYFVYGVLVASVALLLVATFVYEQDLDRSLLAVLLWLLVIGIVTALSLLANGDALGPTGSMRVLRPGLYAILLFYGYQVACKTADVGIRIGVLTAARLILVGQLVIAATQAAGTDVFAFAYEAEKAREFGGLFRVTGSMGNPNWFGWMVAQSTVGILLFQADRRRFGWLALGAVLIIASGSRSLLLLFPFMVVVAEGLRARDERFINISSAVAAGGILVVLFTAVVLYLREALPYLGQLYDMATSGSLRAIHSLEERFENWFNVAEAYRRGGFGTWLVGLGDRPITQTLDNDYLFMLFRTGAVGLGVHLGFILYLVVFFGRRLDALVSRFGLQYLMFALVFGLVAETLGGWFLPIWLLFFAGMAIGSGKMDCRAL